MLLYRMVSKIYKSGFLPSLLYEYFCYCCVPTGEQYIQPARVSVFPPITADWLLQMASVVHPISCTEPFDAHPARSFAAPARPIESAAKRTSSSVRN